MKIRVGSRESALAVAQTRLVMDKIAALFPEIQLELVTMKTTGDKILDKTLDQVGGKGLFVRELDWALLEGRVDLTVHSLKDVPMELPEGLPLLAFFQRGDPRDVLVLPQGKESLRPGGVIGSASPRRALQLKRLYPQNPVKPVRGNILTRLEKLDQGKYDALVLAAAGLSRMGLSHRIARYFSPEELLPAAGQGILAIQGRKGEVFPFLQAINHKETQAAAQAERAFVRAIGGGCVSPAAAFAQVEEGRLRLAGLFPRAEGGCFIRRISGLVEEAEQLGKALAKETLG